ncbi:hypothetical protein PC121_g7744 [Phytophthora cactorum]|nr:hypothetical protein PC121_g7744 [Phytophthora cactorum]
MVTIGSGSAARAFWMPTNFRVAARYALRPCDEHGTVCSQCFAASSAFHSLPPSLGYLYTNQNEDYSTFQVDSPSSSPPRGVESTVPVQEYGHGLGLELLESASRWRHSQSLSLTQRTPSICLHLVGCIKYKIDRC